MLISYKWLQSYFDKKLPPPEKVAELLTFAGFEVESIEAIDSMQRDGTKPTRLPAKASVQTGDETEKDYVLDVKVLPDRACYALSHRGIAREISAAFDIPLNKGGGFGGLSDATRAEGPITESTILDPNISIDEPSHCTRFVARRIEDMKVGPSPKWLREALEAIGQRSINNIVDATNFVMFDIGRPSHAFDADKVQGKLTVRRAKKGEAVVTLDNKRVELYNGELVMADDAGPVGLAGIKGGKRTEVDENTRNIILEAANWNPSYIRLTVTATGIKTEASRRFENRISPLLGAEGIDAVTRLIAEIASTPETKIGKRIVLSFEKPEQRKLAVDPKRISQKLGIPISEEAIVKALARLGIVCEKGKGGLVAVIPFDRLDLSIPEDLAEEVARNVGYDKIPAVLPVPLNKGGARVGSPARISGEIRSGEGGGCEIPKSFYYEWKIREILINAGFSEVMTSSFSEKGDVVIEKPLAEDKKYARPNLLINFGKALKVNIANAPLFGTDSIKIFELGKVFLETGEHTALILGLKHLKKQERNESYFLASTIQTLEKDLGGRINSRDKASKNYGAIFEINLDDVIKNLPEPKNWDISIPFAQSEKFVPFSSYPFIVRDVALFVSPDTAPESVVKIIKENAGSLVVRGPELFDEFARDGRKSLAFRLVFQSFDRTLSDGEVNVQMKAVYDALKANGWEVR